jgi:hypothetical protein
MVMKMTNSTRRISMKGVTLISPFGSAFFLFFLSVPLLLDLVVDFFREETDLVYAGGPQVIDDLNDIPILRAKITLHKDGLVHAVSEQVRDLRREIVDVNAILVEVELAVSCHRNKYGVFLVCFGHVMGVVRFRKLNIDTLLQHGRDDHEDDEQNKHNVRHGRDVDFGGNFSSVTATTHSHMVTSCCPSA